VNFIDGTIPPVREIVIVIPDLYLDPSPEDPWASSTDAPPGAAALGTMPGFEHAARFGTRRSIAADGGWRPWLTRWLGRPDLAPYAPATVVAAVLRSSTHAVATAAATPASPGHVDAATAGAPGTPNLAASPDHAAATTAAAPTLAILPAVDAQQRSPSTGAAAAVTSPAGTAWLATPVHLIAGLTNLHLDRRGLMRLSPEDLARVAEDFNLTFGDTDLHLESLPNGEFLLRGPAAWSAAVTTEPARVLVTGLESSLPKGKPATALKRLGAELEMWLHSHPVNDSRRRRGQLSVSTLWLWGGGTFESLKSSSAPPTDLACGADPFLAGLWHLQGAESHPLPERFGDLLSDPKPERATLVLEITPLLQTNPNWTVFEALVDLDRRYLSPALAALHARALESVVLVANDVEVRLRPGDRLKFWRRARPGIGAILVFP
jgi:hypothetical protein